MRAWTQRNLTRAIALTLGLLASADPAQADPAPASMWCAPGIEAIGEGNCYWLATTKQNSGQSAQRAVVVPDKTLVIFLHGLTGNANNAQWGEQRLAVKLAQTYGFSVLLPRGRLGIGPARDTQVWAWPNSKRAQAEVEDEVLRELLAARDRLAHKAGCFDRTLVFGFSNGAYYATSLAFREKLDVDGYAMFAGGSGNKYDSLLAGRVKQQVPIFVGYGKKDPDRRRQQDLVRVLKKFHWPHGSLAANVGHSVSGEQIESALRFLLPKPEPGGS